MIQEIKNQLKIDPTKILDEVRVFAPATVANMICGFDILGFAVHAPGDEVVMRKTTDLGIKIKEITGDNGKLPIDPKKNTVSHSAWQLLSDLGLEEEFGLEIELHKKMPIGSGLGSSAASTVAGVFALNELLGKPLNQIDLLPYCMEGERLACGTAHADNVAPALLGGIILVQSYEPLIVRALPVPEKLHVALVYPEVEVPTKEARQLIKDRISLQKAVKQWGNIAGLIAALYEKDYEGIGLAMQDELIEPIRSLLIPSFDNMKAIALQEGALCFGISGSGPSVMALTTDYSIAENITQKITEHLKNEGINSFSFVSKVNNEGPTKI